MTQQAMQQNKIYEQQPNQRQNLAARWRVKMNKHRMKDIFIMDHKSFPFPQFFVSEVEKKQLCETQLLEARILLQDFKLANLDACQFQDVKSEVYQSWSGRSGQRRLHAHSVKSR